MKVEIVVMVVKSVQKQDIKRPRRGRDVAGRVMADVSGCLGNKRF